MGIQQGHATSSGWYRESLVDKRSAREEREVTLDDQVDILQVTSWGTKELICGFFPFLKFFNKTTLK